jgi:type II secretory pathway pseudopilin PulG
MGRSGLRSAKLQTPNHNSQISQRGYMMITLMLALALMTLALLAVLPNVKQQILRNREEEMRHRGTAYMRAIQHFYKKFGRYPSRVEELENTNNVRFLRKRYTDPLSRDPVTGKEKDFKFLHQQDITLNNGPVLGQQPGQGGFGGQGGVPGVGGQGSGGFGGAQGGFGGAQGGFGGAGGQTGAGQQTGSGNSASGAFGSSSSGDASSGGGGPGSGKSSSDDSDTEGSPNSPASSSSNPNGSPSSGFNGPTFGGGPILGVASTSKAKTIRVFFKKDHYNDWLFVYLPQADVGGLLRGPINPGMPTGNMGGLTPGQMAAGASGQGGPAQGGFGQGGQAQGLTPGAGQNQGLQTQTPPPSGQAPQQ